MDGASAASAAGRRDARALALLKKILTETQFSEFEKFGSVRLMTHTTQGLPFRYVEVGVSMPGFILFDELNRPIEARNAYPRGGGNSSYDTEWCALDQVIAMILRLRFETMQFIESCCKGGLTPEAQRAIRERTFHLAQG